MTTDSIPATIENGAAPAPRYTREQLEAMRGRRGRKPAEFYAAFPELAQQARRPSAAQPRAGRPRKAARQRSAPHPAISSAMLGGFTIDELCAKVGQKGSKPPAYAILQQAAQFFVDHGGIRLPAATVVNKVVVKPAKAPRAARAPRISPLSAALDAAPPRLRRLVTAILTASI